MGLKRIEQSQGCWANALPDERVFVLLARDITAPWVVLFWCFLRVITFRNWASDPQINEAADCALRMIRERRHVRRVLRSRELNVSIHGREIVDAAKTLRAATQESGESAGSLSDQKGNKR